MHLMDVAERKRMSKPSRLVPARQQLLSVMRLLSLFLMALSLVACGKDEPKSTRPSAERLVCVGGVRSFIPTSGEMGAPLETSPTAAEAIANDVEANDEAETSKLIGNEPTGADDTDKQLRQTVEFEDGVRYALLDAEGKVVEEVVVGKTADGWRGVRYDSCK